MTQILTERFSPSEGALLDLRSLQCIAEAPDRLLAASLQLAWPAAHGVVLEGLEPDGEWSTTGPPGTLRPDGLGDTLAISPGRAIIMDPAGRPVLLEIRERLKAKWPTRARAAVSGALVLLPEVEPSSTSASLRLSRDQVAGKIGFVPPERMADPHLLVLARSVNNGRDWSIDEHRVLQPEHRAIRLLLKRLAGIEHSIWRAEPEGAVWDRQILGRNWVRYQTVAAAALQCTRFQLATHALSTLQRVRLLRELRSQLEKSVESGATELLQLIGPRDEAGAWSGVYDGREG